MGFRDYGQVGLSGEPSLHPYIQYLFLIFAMQRNAVSSFSLSSQYCTHSNIREHYSVLVPSTYDAEWTHLLTE